MTAGRKQPQWPIVWPTKILAAIEDTFTVHQTGVQVTHRPHAEPVLMSWGEPKYIHFYKNAIKWGKGGQASFEAKAFHRPVKYISVATRRPILPLVTKYSSLFILAHSSAGHKNINKYIKISPNKFRRFHRKWHTHTPWHTCDSLHLINVRNQLITWPLNDFVLEKFGGEHDVLLVQVDETFRDFVPTKNSRRCLPPWSPGSRVIFSCCRSLRKCFRRWAVSLDNVTICWNDSRPFSSWPAMFLVFHRFLSTKIEKSFLFFVTKSLEQIRWNMQTTRICINQYANERLYVQNKLFDKNWIFEEKKLRDTGDALCDWGRRNRWNLHRNPECDAETQLMGGVAQWPTNSLHRPLGISYFVYNFPFF